MKSLVAGLGIGKLYVDVLTQLGADVVTVDKDATKNPTFTNFAEACASDEYDTVHICTPNFTHEELFYQYVQGKHKPNSIVFVEKPGFIEPQRWQKASEADVRLMMVKNNQYRSNIQEMCDDAKTAGFIRLSWINYNRVPNPGTWFTTKELAWGGVSRDLMPHLLSYLPMFYPRSFRDFGIYRKLVQQRSQLSDLTSSDYGTVKADGIYNVDDYCAIEMALAETRLLLIADWRSMREDNVGIEMFTEAGAVYPLGLCPEEAYSTMIQTALRNQNVDEFWNDQRIQDIWIHKVLEELNAA
jgi:predicted dehydrogenase